MITPRTPWLIVDTSQKGIPQSNNVDEYDGNCACKRTTIKETKMKNTNNNKPHDSVIRNSRQSSFVCPNCGGIQLQELVASVASTTGDTEDPRESIDCSLSTSSSSSSSSSSYDTPTTHPRSRGISVDSSITALTNTAVGARRTSQWHKEAKHTRMGKVVSAGLVTPTYVQPKGDVEYKRTYTHSEMSL